MKIHRLLPEKMNHDMQYSLDHSAMIHLASAQKDYSNCFRISITLKEIVEAEIEHMNKVLDMIKFKC